MADYMKLMCATCGQTNRLPQTRLADSPNCGHCGDNLVDGSVFDLDPGTLDKAVKDDDLPLLVDFWAPWCGPCRVMAPEFARAARQLMPGVRFAKINTQDHPEAARRRRIQGIPALVLFHRGREVARSAGARPASGIMEFVKTHLPARA